MKNTVFGMASMILLAITTQAVAAPPRHGGGGSPAAWSGHYRHWHSGYWGPRVGVYYGPGFGYWSAWNYGWGWGYGVPYPYAYPYAVGYPFAYAPLVINTTPIQQTYIRQEPVAEASVQPAPPVNYWYYCTQPAGYFPYVQNCNQSWMKVLPQNPVNHQ